MVGAICKREILFHPVVTIRCFGITFLVRALMAGRDQTFLSVLTANKHFQSRTETMPEVVPHCIALERRFMNIYELLADRFANRVDVRNFFRVLASQERSHAELLELCGVAVRQGGWQDKRLEPWREAVSDMERQVEEAETWAAALQSPLEALRLVIDIESTEINRAFFDIIGANNSEFVQQLAAFRTAGAKHIAFICRRIPLLEPDMADACRELARTAAFIASDDCVELSRSAAEW